MRVSTRYFVTVSLHISKHHTEFIPWLKPFLHFHFKGFELPQNETLLCIHYKLTLIQDALKLKLPLTSIENDKCKSKTVSWLTKLCNVGSFRGLWLHWDAIDVNSIIKRHLVSQHSRRTKLGNRTYDPIWRLTRSRFCLLAINCLNWVFCNRYNRLCL